MSSRKFLKNMVSTKVGRFFSHAVAKPDFTKNNYRVLRGNYNSISESHINFFSDLLGENRVSMDLSDLEKYNVDHLKQLRGNSRIALKPKTTDEVSAILKFCNANRLAVCPQGGNTSLVGGSIPLFDEVVVSTELMNSIIHLDDTAGTLTCQSGCVLQSLDEYLEEYGLMMPLDLGAKGSCHIGGNISTNAGGLRLLRYGNLHGNILGLEVVAADGEVIDCLSTLKKDNTGYHLKHLFIGSEGTLGFVTKAAIQCPPRPKAINLAFLGVQKFEKVLNTFKKARHELGEILSAFEVMDTPTMKMMNEHCNLNSPIGEYPFYLIIETSGSNEAHDTEKLNSFLESALVQHFVLNGVVTSEPTKQREIWEIRERVTEAMRRDGHVFMYDITVPLENYYDIVHETRRHVGRKSHRVFGFGHLGDSNVHLQISVEEYTTEMQKDLDKFVFAKVKEMNGSISAEHGIGFLKAKYLRDIKGFAAYNLMRKLKLTMDRNLILNPYKVIIDV